ncbi:hypothetical protein CC77DRAFT_204169 [Alternaria alternata]|uniref:Uncharacterized protein n=1 Tax=Alternaria alternata TaxID=5599 RepID=A0A177DH14_ALTAL|nr:hypothetical protein CC77DRAFT_204169 [Alternaria alternata]OAG18638.1 hypothetical protein CC77DRAFT_204169 [Alternaria alternata]
MPHMPAAPISLRAGSMHIPGQKYWILRFVVNAFGLEERRHISSTSTGRFLQFSVLMRPVPTADLQLFDDDCSPLISARSAFCSSHQDLDSLLEHLICVS